MRLPGSIPLDGLHDLCEKKRSLIAGDGFAAVIASSPPAGRDGHRQGRERTFPEAAPLSSAGPGVAAEHLGGRWGRNVPPNKPATFNGPSAGVVAGVPVPVSWTSGRPKHQAALRLSFSRARAGVMYPCRWSSQSLL